MVNDVNKPQSTDEYAQLNERLIASNHHLQEMQEEHSQLLGEMESLRHRASMLSRIDAESYEETTTTTRSTTNASATSSLSATTATSSEANSVQEHGESGTAAADDVDEADYIRDKLNEIARLKAQLQRVQNMTNTTKQIEEHLATRSMQTSSSHESSTYSSNESHSEISSSTSATSSSNNARIGIDDTVGDAKAELLATMTSMFTDYASDLRGQADNLRAERERIRELKEKIIASKTQF